MACTQRAAVPASRVILEKTAMVVGGCVCGAMASRRWRMRMQGAASLRAGQRATERASSESNSERSPRGARPLGDCCRRVQKAASAAAGGGEQRRTALVCVVTLA